MVRQVGLQTLSRAQVEPSAQSSCAHGSAMHIPEQQTRPGLQAPSHWLATHTAAPAMTAHTSPDAHSLRMQGSGWQAPLTQIVPDGQLAHGLTHCPSRQNCGAGQARPKQGSGTHDGGSPTHSWPAGQGWTRQVSSTQLPRRQTKPGLQATPAHGSTHDAVPSGATSQRVPDGHCSAWQA
jgi:hypothetical protein